jgi:hypothetical protein
MFWRPTKAAISTSSVRWPVRKYLLPAILLFTLTINHAAFLSWFQDDDLDNLSWGPVENGSTYAGRLVSPFFHRDTFRPVGHFMYFVLGKAVRMNYAWYEGWLMAGHLLNIALLWRLLRKLGLDEISAAAGTLFFAFHQACFFAYWRPMYVFDVYCATFCLLAILAWLSDRWILSFVCYIVAYRAKEMAVMLPVVLLALEALPDPRAFLAARKRWLRLVPFFAASLSFGLQAIHGSAVTDDPYSIHLTPATFWQCLKFYAGKFLMFPYAALALIPLPLIFRRDWRVLAGVVSFFALLFPMLAFPGRLIPVYIYVPLAGAAIAIAAIVTHPGARRPALALLGLWIALCAGALVRFERLELEASADNRNVARALQNSVTLHPEITHYIFEGRPESLRDWGITGALSSYIRYRTGKRPDLNLQWAGILNPAEFQNEIPTAQLTWDGRTRQASIIRHTTDWQDWAYLPTSQQGIPIWQLGAGWMPIIEGPFRIVADHAEARLLRPADARFFELVVNAGDVVERFNKATLTVKLGDHALEPKTIDDHEDHRFRWDLPPGAAGTVKATIDTDHFFIMGTDRRAALRVIGLGFH